MALEIYWASGSPFAWRALLFAEIKRIPYESKLIEFSKRGNRTPEYLAMNPRGKVPALRDGNYTLYESVAVMAYLEKRVPEPPMFGKTPDETGTIWRMVAEADAYFAPAMAGVVRPIFFGGAAENASEVREAASKVHEELGNLETRLSSASWLAGDAVTAADVAYYPMLQVILRAATREAAQPLDLGFTPIAERYPSLAAWMKRIEALPGHDRTYPPHWRRSNMIAEDSGGGGRGGDKDQETR